jgi:hypothetical protein
MHPGRQRTVRCFHQPLTITLEFKGTWSQGNYQGSPLKTLRHLEALYCQVVMESRNER